MRTCHLPLMEREQANSWKKMPSEYPAAKITHFLPGVRRNKKSQLLITLRCISGTNYLLGNDYLRSRFSPGTCLWPTWQLLSPPGISLQTEHMEQLLGLTLILFMAISSTHLDYFVSMLSLWILYKWQKNSICPLKGNKDKKSLFPINTTGHSQTGTCFRVWC